jgi:hypothetical protein
MRGVQKGRLRALRRRDGGAHARLEDDGVLVRRLSSHGPGADVRSSRAGRTGRSWYGSYAVSYADPIAAGGDRWVGGHTSRQRAVTSARRHVEEGAALAEVRLGDREGEVIARFPKERAGCAPKQLDREIAAAIGRRGALAGIGRIAGRAIAYVRWADGSMSDYTLAAFRRAFGVSASRLATGADIVEVLR